MAEQKLAQMQEMRNYVSACQGMFESLITELVLAQPDDPQAFLVAGLQKMTASEIGKVQARVKGITKTSGWQPSKPDASKNQEVMLRMFAKPGKETEVLSMLQELKGKITQSPGCLGVSVYSNSECIFLNQKWATKAALDNFNDSGIVDNYAAQFQRILARSVVYDVYSEVQ